MNKINQTKKALVIGGSGFVGTHLSEMLLALNYEIEIADLVEPENESYNFFQCDVRKPIDYSPKVVPDVVFILAAVHRTPGHNPDEYYETNVLGAINVVNWCVDVGVRKIIFTSSISVYGPSDEIKDEDSILAPESDYGRSKMMAEKIYTHWASSEPSTRSLIIFRPAVIFGAGEGGNFSRLAKALRQRRFFYPGGPNTVKSCGYVVDLCRAMLFAANNDKNLQLFNFAFPRAYTIGEICNSFNRVAKYRLPFSIPLEAASKILRKFRGPIAMLGDRITKLVQPTHVEPVSLIQQNFTWEFDLDSALMHWRKNSPVNNEFI